MVVLRKLHRLAVLHLEELRAVVVPLEYCQFPRVEVLLVRNLANYIAQVNDELDISIGRSVMQKGIVAVVSLYIRLTVSKQFKEDIVLVIS